ncbi:Gfo/Idh/MocA family oxidoreductase [Siculibacillus lacustris]|uniref:Gfo/Idh/MocA family oxidoreductase n=1 Tax=Siculibacillus lacustris TaxID=1549641 RepID=A0A4Q9VQ30_9HYPH|nr:Gfo/Idh/MocA family oxidoreductase [Siculibacillus lacustris]TBW37620.1 Gfo/Idh/MocA family oxidoreductase [Siculibacillus lacustris]
MSPAPLRLGIVGLGMAVKPHAAALADLADRITVVGGYAPSPARRTTFAATTGFPVTDDLDALIADPSVAAMLILTPPPSHLDLVARCASVGKHVLLEKPLEVTLPRASALVARMEAADRRLGVVFQHRFRPVVQRLRAVMAEGALGDLIAASVEVRWWRPASYYVDGRGSRARDGGGVLLSQAIHTLDVFCTLVGLPAEVFAYTATSPNRAVDTENVVAAALRFGNGAIGTLGATTAADPGFPERIEITGTRGTATLEGDALRLHWSDGRDEIHDGSGATGGGADPMAFDHGPHRALIADFATAIADGRDPETSGRSALAVHRLIEALLRSAAERRAVAPHAAA